MKIKNPKEKFDNHLDNLIKRVRTLSIDTSEKEWDDIKDDVYKTLNFHSIHREFEMSKLKDILESTWEKTIHKMTDDEIDKNIGKYDDKFLFVNDVMTEFNISRSTLRRWGNMGLKKIKIKRKIYFLRSDVMKFINHLND
jgi:response regulator of citrate/malate metabolism